MKLKKIITFALLAFAGLSVVWLIAKEASTSSSPQVTNPATITASNPSLDTGITVYYFHNNVRCVTCKRIEAWTKQAVETYFAEDFAKGDIKWQAVNIDQPENEHFIQDFQIVSKAVVIVQRKDGKVVKWENLPEIWQRVSDELVFMTYIRDEVLNFRRG